MWVYGCLFLFVVLLKMISGRSEAPKLPNKPSAGRQEAAGRQPSSYPWKPETRSCHASHSCTAPSATQTGSPTPAPRNGRPRRRMSQGPETTQQAQASVDPPEGITWPGLLDPKAENSSRPLGLCQNSQAWNRKGPAVGFHQGLL